MIEFLVGIILGAIFFGGLYWTVKKLNEVKNPSLLIVFSFLLRVAVLLIGLYYVSQNGFQGVLLSLLGIIIIRYIMIYAINSKTTSSNKD